MIGRVFHVAIDFCIAVLPCRDKSHGPHLPIFNLTRRRQIHQAQPSLVEKFIFEYDFFEAKVTLT